MVFLRLTTDLGIQSGADFFSLHCYVLVGEDLACLGDSLLILCTQLVLLRQVAFPCSQCIEFYNFGPFFYNVLC